MQNVISMILSTPIRGDSRPYNFKLHDKVYTTVHTSSGKKNKPGVIVKFTREPAESINVMMMTDTEDQNIYNYTELMEKKAALSNAVEVKPILKTNIRKIIDNNKVMKYYEVAHFAGYYYALADNFYTRVTEFQPSKDICNAFRELSINLNQ